MGQPRYLLPLLIVIFLSLVAFLIWYGATPTDEGVSSGLAWLLLSLVLLTVLAALALAILNLYLSNQAERQNPARRFVEVGSLRLHYTEVGEGPPLVLLHGNGSMIQDFECSGLIDEVSMKYRVIVFDRPGFGHSPRPRGTVWTAERQAELIALAMNRLGLSKATVLGHSWGASVAVALGLNHRDLVDRLVLVSGYYYPTPRTDVLLLSGPALPVVGPIISYTIAPLVSRMIWPLLVKKIFAPAGVPAKFEQGFPKEMAVRPSQLRASAEESALLIPTATALQHRYRELNLPVTIAAGANDQIITTDRQSAHLHEELPHSTFRRIQGSGHMVHQTATHEITDAVDEISMSARGSARSARPTNLSSHSSSRRA
jgi:pimeloyl-ACP methyl ester carboxylesterase